MNFQVICVFFALTSIGFTAPTFRDDKEEATKIALESTGELIAEPQLVNKIQSDLRLIRSLDKSVVKKRFHAGKWIPGQVLTKASLTPKQVQEVEQSEFKPVQIVKQGGNTLFLFKKPYHPEKLGKLLKLRFSFDTKPNFLKSEGKNDQILYRHDLSTYFWNSANGKNCLDGCAAQYSVSFSENDVDKI